MSALPAETLMQWGAFTVEVAPDGAGFRLLHGADEWAAFSLHRMTPTGRFTDDADEVEHSFALDDLHGAVRHSIAQNWTIRWALRAAQPSELDEPPLLRVRPGAASVVWAWPAGAEAVLAIGPRRRGGPVVGLRLTQGWLGADCDGFALAPEGLLLAPGRRWVGSLRAELLPDLRGIGARLPAWLAPLELTAGQPWEFRQPDQALVVQPPATTRAEGDAVQVLGGAGRAGVLLHSARGLTALTLSFAPTLDTLLAAVASAVLRGDRPASPAAAFVVAEALGRSLISQPLAAEEWLDDYDWQRETDLLAIASGIVRGQRAGNARPVRAALRRLRVVHPQLGFGRVVMAAWLAGLALGDDARDDAVALLTRPSGADWVGLELNVLNLRSVEVAGPLFDGLINALGGDLPGEPVGLSAVQQAQLTGLLQLCPEEWPMAGAAAVCATKNSRRLLAAVASSGFGGPDDLAVLAWLALGESLV
ncbi:hypothetical protein [Micropruina sp.]|uniref:hypothetical protein n=1 Tax=Micropruina sp. TaxID=2737536 RepID=UPI0039E49243